MCATFTEDDLEKRVENANGEVIGVITEIEGEMARIEPRSGVVDSIRAALGWSRGRGEPVTVHEDVVDEITAETVYIGTGPAAAEDEAHASETEPDESPTELESESMAEPRADSPSGVDDATGEDDEAGIAVDEMDRGIATDESDRDAPSSTDVDERDPGPIETPNSDASDGDERKSSPIEALETDSSDSEEFDAAVDDEIGGADTDTDIDADGEPADLEATDAISDAERPKSVGDPAIDDPVAESDAATDPDEPSDTTAATGVSESDSGSGSGETAETPESEPSDAPATEADASDPSHASDSMDVSEDAVERDSASPASQAQQDVDEPAARTATDERTLADEVPTGIDDDSLEDVGGSDAEDGADRSDAGEADRTDLVDELNQGVDIESAVDEDESDTARSEGEHEDPETEYAEEFETGVDIEAAAETEPDDAEAASDANRTVGESNDREQRDPAAGIDTGLDATAAVDPAQKTSVEPERESSAEPEQESTTESDSETTTASTGQRTDVDTGPSTAMHRAMSEGAESAVTTDETADRPADDRDRTRTRSSDRSSSNPSPVTPAVAAQRAALTGSRELLEVGLTVQQNATRAAIENAMLAQRGSFELAKTAARGYLNAVGSTTSTGSGSGRTIDRAQEGDRARAFDESLEETIAAIEETRSRIDDDELARALTAHLEELRTLRAEPEAPEQQADRVAALLERQTELLERCQRHLEESRSE